MKQLDLVWSCPWSDITRLWDNPQDSRVPPVRSQRNTRVHSQRWLANWPLIAANNSGAKSDCMRIMMGWVSGSPKQQLYSKTLGRHRS